jgi:hypothetical protein
VLVGDEQPDAGETPLDELGQQHRPARFGLVRPDVDREQATESVGTDAVGDQGRDVLDGPGPSGIDKRGVQVQVRDGLGDGSRRNLSTSSSSRRVTRLTVERPTRLPRSASATLPMSHVDTPRTYDSAMASSTSA